jgi:hypothetical protein
MGRLSARTNLANKPKARHPGKYSNHFLAFTVFVDKKKSYRSAKASPPAFN